jgi:hypothetical protein
MILEVSMEIDVWLPLGNTTMLRPMLLVFFKLHDWVIGVSSAQIPATRDMEYMKKRETMAFLWNGNNGLG